MSENKVKWHPYPEEKPKKEGNYLTTVGLLRENYINMDFYYITEKREYFAYSNPLVIAWAEMPEPYKGGIDGQA